MSERKIQTKTIPLRVRIRPADDYAQISREQFEFSSMVSEPAPRKSVSDERRIQQIRQLLRLCDMLRADLSLDEALQYIVSAIVSCTGFRMLTVNLIEPTGKFMLPVAFAGISEKDQRALREKPFAVEKFFDLMRPEFRISQSYFIPHEHFGHLHDVLPIVFPDSDVEQYELGRWHREDVLLVPLYSTREQKLLGFLAPDGPEDGLVPGLESIEIVELFAHRASLAIDNARLFQERQAEQRALEAGIAAICEDLANMQDGDLRVHVRATHPQLQPVADAVNTMVDQLSAFFSDVQVIARSVDGHMQHIQKTSALLVSDIMQQKEKVQLISGRVIQEASTVSVLSQNAARLSGIAAEVVDVTNEAQGMADRAFEGMGSVREATMQSSRTMKALSESGQEINETTLVMQDMTMRMHLLALNAAIEVTRAGEAGQGFSVIAQEIRTLATQSTEIARKVNAYIRAIQQETAVVSQSVEQSTQQVVMQTELVTQTGVALDAISVVAGQLTRLIQSSVDTAATQADASRSISGSVEEILHMTGDVNTHMQEMQQSTERLVEMTDALRSKISLMQMR